MAAIRKDSNTGMIFGVCSGLSEWSQSFGYSWLHIPVHLIRVVTFAGLIISIGIIGGIYCFLAGVLSDTAECNLLRRKALKHRLASLYKTTWWKAEVVETTWWK